MIFDAHTHLNNITKPYKKIVCASTFAEWERLAFIRDENVIPAYGIHPWFIDHSDIAELEKFIKGGSCLLGECGLDRLRPHPEQYDIFIMQLEMARKYNKIVVIHCVKAWDLITEALKSFSDLSYIFHRFNGGAEIVRQLPENSYFSLGLNGNLQKIVATLPKDKILFETDDSDYDVAEVYEKAGIPEDVIYENAKRLLGDLI